MLKRVIYSSRATRPLTLEEAEAPLRDARQGNTERGVSGVLVYKDGVFLLVNQAMADSRIFPNK